MSRAASLPVLGNPPQTAYFTATPRDVSIELTGRCNLRCRHCFNESEPGHPHELPVERITAVLDEMQSWGLRKVRLSGGEPTVHPRFREVVAACRAREIDIGLNTNGIYAPEMLTYLQTAPIATFFLSLDGLEANHDAIRGAGTFVRAVHSSRTLHRAGQKVILSCHVAEGNRGDVEGLVALAADLAVDIKFAPMRPVGRAVRELPESLIRPLNLYGVVRQLTSLRRRYPHIHIYTDFDLLEAAPAGANTTRDDPGCASCRAGRRLVNVRSDGTVNACAFFDALGDPFRAGSVHDERLADIWRQSPAFAPFRIQRKSDTCQSCGFYRVQCAGGCPAIAFAVTGRLDALDPTCFAPLVEPETFAPVATPVTPLTFAELVAPPAVGAEVLP